MCHPKFVDLVFDHRARDDQGADICFESLCMTCALRDVLAAYIQTPYGIDDMNTAVNDWFGAYAVWVAENFNPIGRESAADQCDPKELLAFQIEQCFNAIHTSSQIG